MADSLMRDLLSWNRLPLEPPPVGGRGSQISDLAKRLDVKGSSIAGQEHLHVSSTSLKVDPERVALPTQAAGFKPEEHLTEPLLSEYLKFRVFHLQFLVANDFNGGFHFIVFISFCDSTGITFLTLSKPACEI